MEMCCYSAKASAVEQSFAIIVVRTMINTIKTRNQYEAKTFFDKFGCLEEEKYCFRLEAEA